MSPRSRYVAYFALAIACGVVLGTWFAPAPVEIVVLAALGLVARLLRRQIQPGPSSPVLVAQWVGCFAAVWLVLALALGSPPF